MAETARRLNEPQIQPDPAERWSDGSMAVVAVASPAAQSGKTTLAAHLAVQAARLGDGSVAVVDATAGGSLSEWAAKRRNPGPKSIRSDLGRLREDILRLRNERKYALCIVDIETSDSISIRSALAAAHLVVIPCPLAESALDAATIMAEDVRYMDRAAVVVINGVEPGQEFWTTKTFRLRKRGLLSPVALHWDEAAAGAMSRGRTVLDNPEETLLVQDIERLWPVLRRVLADARSRHVAKRRRQRQQRLRRLRVVAVASTGGAERRTTLAAHLAVQAARSGVGNTKVLLASIEDRGLEQWAEMQGEISPIAKAVPYREVGSLLESAGESGFELCVLACPLGRDVTVTQIFETVDLLVLPIEPGGKSVARTLLLTADLRGLPAVFALFHDPSDPRAALAASRQIVEGGGRIAGRLAESKDFAEAVAGGKTVMEIRPESRAAREVVELWVRLRGMLFRG